MYVLQVTHTCIHEHTCSFTATCIYNDCSILPLSQQSSKGPSPAKRSSYSAAAVPTPSSSKPRPKKPVKETPKSVTRRSRRLGKQSPVSDSSPSASSDDDAFEPPPSISPLPPKRRKICPPVVKATRVKSEAGSPVLAAPPAPAASLQGERKPQGRRTKRKRIPYTLVEASKGNHCPTPGEGCWGIHVLCNV